MDGYVNYEWPENPFNFTPGSDPVKYIIRVGDFVIKEAKSYKNPPQNSSLVQMYWRLLAGPVSNKSFLQRSTVFTFWAEPAPFSPVRRSFNKAPVRVCIQLYKLRPSDSTHLDLGGESSTIVLNPLFCFKNIDSKDQFKQKTLTCAN